MASLTQWTGIWAQEDSEEQGSLVCYRSWGCKQPGTTYNWTTTIQFEFTFEKYSVTPLVFQIKAGYISRIISKNALCPQKITPGLWQWYFLPNIELPTLSNVPWEVLWNHHRTPKRDTSSENGVLNKSGHIHLAQWKIKQKKQDKKNRTPTWICVSSFATESSTSSTKQKVIVVYSLSCVQLLVTLRNIAHQTPLSMGFSRQEYWSG